MKIDAMRCAVVMLLMLAVTVPAQTTTQIPLNYNFNGIVHAGEAGLPDDPNGYRSISDRGLDFSAGVPADALLSRYQIVGTAGALDIVHLGNRNTVDNARRPFDPMPNGDDFGIQPNWLPAVDQTGPQVTTLATPIALDSTSSASFIYQISNGGGSFDVTFTYFSGSSFTTTLSGGDWFGGIYAGTAFTDSGLPDSNLSIVEGTVDLSGSAGEVISQISFSNSSNLNAGIAILGANAITGGVAATDYPILLNYNFNGIVHAGEAGLPDDPAGFRSISDRALDFSAGVPADPLLAPYTLVDTAGALDIVHVGNRNTVDNGNWMFDAIPDGDDIGTQPAWLPMIDQTAPQATAVTPVLLTAGSNVRVLFQISNGGGAFDVTLGFQSGNSVTATLSGSDWFGGTFAGTALVDSGAAGNNLSITEGIIDLSANAGEILTLIAFGNRSNAVAGYAIMAANVKGCLPCANAGGVSNLGGGNGPQIVTSGNTALGCPLNVAIGGASPNVSGSLLLGVTRTQVPLGLVFSACTATLNVANTIAVVPAATDPNGGYSVDLPGSTDPTFCGVTLYFQYGEIAIGPACPIRLSDALGITIGN